MATDDITPTDPPADQPSDVPTADVIPISRGRGRPKKDAEQHVTLALLMLERLRLNTGQEICFHRDELYIYGGADGPHAGIWKAYEGQDKNNYIDTQIHGTVCDCNAEAAKVAKKEGREKAFVPPYDEENKLRVEARNYARSMPELHFSGDWDSHGLVPLQNGLFDPATLKLTPYAPQHRATKKFAVSYDPAAGFDYGKRMLADMFAPYPEEKRAAYIKLIQQFIYVALFLSGKRIGRRLRKCLWFRGQRNSGKSQLLEIVSRAIGNQYCSRTTLIQLGSKDEGRFALEGLLDKVAWIADEVADEHTKIPAGIIKAIWAEDEIKADRKGKTALQARFLGASMFSSNNMPRTLDSASGFATRFTIVFCPAEFDEIELTGVAKIARENGFTEPVDLIEAEQLSGLLNWALEAREYIEKEKRFDEPEGVLIERDDLTKSANPILEFIEENIEVCDIKLATAAHDIYEAYREYYEADNGTKQTAKTPKMLCAKINQYYNHRRGTVKKTSAQSEDGWTLFCGLRLNESGLNYWRSARARKSAGDKEIKAMSANESFLAYDITEIGDQLKRVKKELCPEAPPLESKTKFPSQNS